jgi:arylsulfatase A-like enzyme
VVLITLETTRADHLSCDGYSRTTTPHIDRLAQSGALFTETFAVSPRTNPSLASLFTSLYPHEHGVRNLVWPLDPANKTLTEILRDNGYTTGAVQTHPRLTPASGFAQGFQTYDDNVAAHPRADLACNAAANWIRTVSQTKQPWFLWLHLMDPHWIYLPPLKYRTAYGPEDPRPLRLYEDLSTGHADFGDVTFRNTMPPDEVKSFVNLYDGEIRFTDESVGTLLTMLGQAGMNDRTIFVITADHGESLGEHDYFFEHGDFGTEPEIHIPLVLVIPGVTRPGTRITRQVRNIDITPTILDALHISYAGKVRGTSLLPMLTGDAKSRFCFGETGENYFPQNTRREVPGIKGKWRWLRDKQFKLVYVPHAQTEEWRLFNLKSDPGETEDVASQYPEVAARMKSELLKWIKEDRMANHSTESPLSPEAREELKALGYVD